MFVCCYLLFSVTLVNSSFHYYCYYYGLLLHVPWEENGLFVLIIEVFPFQEHLLQPNHHRILLKNPRTRMSRKAGLQSCNVK